MNASIGLYFMIHPSWSDSITFILYHWESSPTSKNRARWMAPLSFIIVFLLSEPEADLKSCARHGFRDKK